MAAQQPHRLSIFSQSLSAAAFVAYLLGAVVPLMALAFVTQQFVLPGLEDRNQAMGLVALIVSVGALSLAAFLLLRRITLDALGRMGGDNESLQSILRAARSLESRIIGLAEAVDSMTSSTSYKTALPAERALAEVREGSGRQFDPAVADAFLALVDEGALELESS